ncbi:MAG: hypothetical protein V1831_00770 [Candidatus Woesearchaeota archaeon]
MPIIPGSTQEMQLTSLMIREIAEIQRKDKEFLNAIRNLDKNYSISKLGNLQKKYIKKPQKFKERLREMTENFVRDYTTFRQKYTELFNIIIQTIDVSGKEFSIELHKVDELIKHIEGKVAENPKQFYFSPPAREKFADEFKKAMNALAVQLRIEYAQYLGATRGKRIATGMFSKLIKNRSAGRTGRRQAKKLLEEVEGIQQIAQEIEQELATGIRQDFIALLLQYVIALEKTDKSLKQIKKDLVIIMDNVEDDVRAVIKKIAPFIVIMENDPTVKPEIEKARLEFDEQQRKIIDLLKNETKWPRFEQAIAVDINKNERALISALTSVNQRHINAAVQNVVNREMGAMAR